VADLAPKMPHMTHWEYKFIDLHKDMYDDFKRVAAEVRQAGADGWEAVGQVTMTCPGVTVPMLLLKRPVP
jgi:hypothetical protein